MPEDISSTIEKALALNLDPLKYGTIVEIGAGQEVARWFFQAGAAAGTVAKTMSAYDMQFSDQIYGAAADGRYVSRGRLERMLEREFELVVERIEEHRPDDSRFFAFADTVTAQSFNKRAECHGWLGIRWQRSPKAEPDNIILHVRMLDETNLDQQEALGILGVNLIYGAYMLSDQPAELLRSLTDNLRWGRLEIDLVEFNGPSFENTDNRLMALELVKASLTRAVLFDPDGHVVIPAEEFYKKRVLVMRGEFQDVAQSDVDRFAHAKGLFDDLVAGGAILSLAELTMAQLDHGQSVDTVDFLARVERLSAAGYYVLISEYFRYFRLRQYLARYSREPVALVTDLKGLGEIFHEEYYDGISGGILEGLGQTFPENTHAYVYPDHAGDPPVDLEQAHIRPEVRPLVDFLAERGQIIPVKDYQS
jgi:hypothetical protein